MAVLTLISSEGTSADGSDSGFDAACDGDTEQATSLNCHFVEVMLHATLGCVAATVVDSCDQALQLNCCNLSIHSAAACHTQRSS